jgi:hypothetical protein
MHGETFYFESWSLLKECGGVIRVRETVPVNQ